MLAHSTLPLLAFALTIPLALAFPTRAEAQAPANGRRGRFPARRAAHPVGQLLQLPRSGRKFPESPSSTRHPGWHIRRATERTRHRRR